MAQSQRKWLAFPEKDIDFWGNILEVNYKLCLADNISMKFLFFNNHLWFNNFEIVCAFDLYEFGS